MTTLPHLSDAVTELLGDSESDLVVFHTDITWLGFPEGVRTALDALRCYSETLERACSPRALVFPTFNYDFCRSGIYDTSADRCQVGALNEYYRVHRARVRTLTPVFNFCASDPDRLPREYSPNPFDDRSAFAHLRRRGAMVVFLGASFSANTFVHHVEELAGIGYRYLKPFPGVVRDAGHETQLTLHYRVRPLQEDVVVYDWERLMDDLRDARILRTKVMGKVNLYAYRADALAAYWTERIADDETYLLTPLSIARIRELAGEVGYPFVYENLETERGGNA